MNAKKMSKRSQQLEQRRTAAWKAVRARQRELLLKDDVLATLVRKWAEAMHACDQRDDIPDTCFGSSLDESLKDCWSQVLEDLDED